MESPSKVIAAFVGVFIAGAVFGGFFSLGIGARWAHLQAPAPAVAAPAAPGTAPAAKPVRGHPPVRRPQLLQIPLTWQAPMLMRRYAERLELTPEQRKRILPLFQRATEDYRFVQQNTFRETAIILQRLQQDLAKELTPVQRRKLAIMEAKQREALQRMEERQRELRKENAKKRMKEGPGKPGPAKPAPGTAPAQSAAPEPAAPEAGTAASTAPAAAPASSTGTATAENND